MAASDGLQAFIDATNAGYERVHVDFEEQFWGTKMALTDPKFSVAALTEAKGKITAFLSDASRLAETREWLKRGGGSEQQLKVLKVFERTFSCYIMDSAECKALFEELTKLEAELEVARNKMSLGAKLAEGFVAMSSVQLRNRMQLDSSEEVRKACYEGLVSIGPFICGNGFVDILKKRNRMARQMGYEDFYDYKVTTTEGFNKAKLFEMLDALESATREINTKALQTLKSEKGASAEMAWNRGFMLAGRCFQYPTSSPTSRAAITTDMSWRR